MVADRVPAVRVRAATPCRAIRYPVTWSPSPEFAGAPHRSVTDPARDEDPVSLRGMLGTDPAVFTLTVVGAPAPTTFTATTEKR